MLPAPIESCMKNKLDKNSDKLQILPTPKIRIFSIIASANQLQVLPIPNCSRLLQAGISGDKSPNLHTKLLPTPVTTPEVSQPYHQSCREAMGGKDQTVDHDDLYTVPSPKVHVAVSPENNEVCEKPTLLVSSPSSLFSAFSALGTNFEKGIPSNTVFSKKHTYIRFSSMFYEDVRVLSPCIDHSNQTDTGVAYTRSGTSIAFLFSVFDLKLLAWKQVHVSNDNLMGVLVCV